MSSIIENHVQSFVATEAIGAHILVKKSTDGVAICGVADTAIGVTIANVASGDPVTVRLFNSFGSAFMKAGAAIVKNALVYGIAAGKVDDAGPGAPLGYCQSTAADGDVVEVLLLGQLPIPMLASASQAVATDLPTALLLLNSMRTAAITHGLIKGAA